MENKTLINNNVEFACDLADQMLEADGYLRRWVVDDEGNESYKPEVQERFEQYYSIIIEALENEK